MPASKKTAKSKWYAVAVGHRRGIYSTWDECRVQVNGYSRAVYMSFSTRSEAEAFLERHDQTNNNINNNPQQQSVLAVDNESLAAMPTPTISMVPIPSTSSLEQDHPSLTKEPHKNNDPTSRKKRKNSHGSSENNKIRLHIHITFDGGSRGNPGIAGAGAVVTLTETPSAATPTVHPSTTTAIADTDDAPPPSSSAVIHSKLPTIQNPYHSTTSLQDRNNSRHSQNNPSDEIAGIISSKATTTTTTSQSNVIQTTFTTTTTASRTRIPPPTLNGRTKDGANGSTDASDTNGPMVSKTAAAATSSGEPQNNPPPPPFHKVIHIRDYLGPSHTNNQAEYQGVVAALRVAWVEVVNHYQCKEEKKETNQESFGATDASSVRERMPYISTQLKVQGDSHLILQQLCGVWECRHVKLRPYHTMAVQYLQRFGEWGDCQRSLQHIYRQHNKAADGTLYLRM